MSSSAAILSQVKSGEACHAFVGCAGKGGSTELEKRERAWIAQTTHSAFDCEIYVKSSRQKVNEYSAFMPDDMYSHPYINNICLIVTPKQGMMVMPWATHGHGAKYTLHLVEADTFQGDRLAHGLSGDISGELFPDLTFTRQVWHREGRFWIEKGYISYHFHNKQFRLVAMIHTDQHVWASYVSAPFTSLAKRKGRVHNYDPVSAKLTRATNAEARKRAKEVEDRQAAEFAVQQASEAASHAERNAAKIPELPPTIVDGSLLRDGQSLPLPSCSQGPEALLPLVAGMARPSSQVQDLGPHPSDMCATTQQQQKDDQSSVAMAKEWGISVEDATLTMALVQIGKSGKVPPAMKSHAETMLGAPPLPFGNGPTVHANTPWTSTTSDGNPNYLINRYQPLPHVAGTESNTVAEFHANFTGRCPGIVDTNLKVDPSATCVSCSLNGQLTDVPKGPNLHDNNKMSSRSGFNAISSSSVPNLKTMDLFSLNFAFQLEGNVACLTSPLMALTDASPVPSLISVAPVGLSNIATLDDLKAQNRIFNLCDIVAKWGYKWPTVEVPVRVLCWMPQAEYVLIGSVQHFLAMACSVAVGSLNPSKLSENVILVAVNRPLPHLLKAATRQTSVVPFSKQSTTAMLVGHIQELRRDNQRPDLVSNKLHHIAKSPDLFAAVVRLESNFLGESPLVITDVQYMSGHLGMALAYLKCLRKWNQEPNCRQILRTLHSRTPLEVAQLMTGHQALCPVRPVMTIWDMRHEGGLSLQVTACCVQHMGIAAHCEDMDTMLPAMKMVDTCLVGETVVQLLAFHFPTGISEKESVTGLSIKYFIDKYADLHQLRNTYDYQAAHVVFYDISTPRNTLVAWGAFTEDAIKCVCVKAAYRRQGVGLKVVEAILGILEVGMHHNRIEVQTVQVARQTVPVHLWNTVTQPFLEKAGFIKSDEGVQLQLLAPLEHSMHCIVSSVPDVSRCKSGSSNQRDSVADDKTATSWKRGVPDNESEDNSDAVKKRCLQESEDLSLPRMACSQCASLLLDRKSRKYRLCSLCAWDMLELACKQLQEEKHRSKLLEDEVARLKALPKLVPKEEPLDIEVEEVQGNGGTLG